MKTNASRSGVVARTSVRGPLPLLGPAFVAAIAYVDPGNFATNVSAGSLFGYLLVWVVVAGNLMAMLIQYLSAKAGIASGKNLAELCRDHFPRPVSRGLWVQAEVVVIATDVAEVLGGALALKLLFGVPLFAGGVITSVVAFGLLVFQNRGHRPYESVITALLAVILLGFLYNLLLSGVDPGGLANGVIPRFEGTDSLLLAAGMLGATVMPHAIYLHGALTQDRYVRTTPADRHAVAVAGIQQPLQHGTLQLGAGGQHHERGHQRHHTAQRDGNAAAQETLHHHLTGVGANARGGEP